MLAVIFQKIEKRAINDHGTYVPEHQHATGAAPKGTNQTTGISRAGLTTKIHAAVDRKGNQREFEVTGGNISEIKQAKIMIEDLAPMFNELVADKGYDSDSFRSELITEVCSPAIPVKSNSDRPNPGFHKTKYNNRHRVENIFARLKHLRSIAQRFDKLKVMY